MCHHHFQNWANLSSDFSFQRENSEARLTFLLREGGWLTRSDLLEMVTSLANALPQAAKLPSSYYLAEFVGSELVNSLFSSSNYSSSGRLFLQSRIQNVTSVDPAYNEPNVRPIFKGKRRREFPKGSELRSLRLVANLSTN